MNAPAQYLTKSASTDLGQRSRADLQILGSIQVAAYNHLRSAARERFAGSEEGRALTEAHAGGDASKEAVRGRVEKASALAGEDRLFRMERFLQRYVAEENWRRAIVAVEQRRDQFAPFVAPPQGDTLGSLELNDALELPRFFTEVEFHLQPGGWEGYDLYGPALAYGIYPHVFSRGGFASMPATPEAIGYRPRIIKMLPRNDYRRIFDAGCGSGSTTRWLQQNFPDAELVACDLSAVQLKSGHTMAEKAGVAIKFRQADARATGEPDASFDLVVMNALAHEMPPKANVAAFQEAFRILEPGGDLLMMDPPPFRSVDPFQGAILHWDTDHRDEPFFSSALLSDWEAELKAIGFTDVRSEVLDGIFPWVLIARKPG